MSKIQEHATDRDGSAYVVQRFSCSGRMDIPAYLDFVADRARWLDIRGWAQRDFDGVTVLAAGPEAMVGAFEMACWLGPLTAVIDMDVTDVADAPVPTGFSIR